MTPETVAASFALGLVLAIVLFLAVTSYNAVMALRQRIDKAWANIDVVLKQRHDQLPALVSAVRGLLAFEQGVLTDVARARAAYSPSEPIPEQVAAVPTTKLSLSADELEILTRTVGKQFYDEPIDPRWAEPVRLLLEKLRTARAGASEQAPKQPAMSAR